MSISVTNMDREKDRKAKPTPADIRASKQLKNIWLRIPKTQRPTQDKIAERWMELWPESSMTQSGISQYMNGNVPLNPVAVQKFSVILECKPSDIRDDVPVVSQLKPTERSEEWPFKDISPKRYQSMPPEWRLKAEGAVLAVLLSYETQRKAAVPRSRKRANQ